jgi:hypothetical protein
VRKFLLTILVVIYAIAVVGVPQHTHFCMGKKIGVSLFAKKTSKCSVCGMSEKKGKNGCCKNTKSLAKLNQAHKNANGFNAVQPIYAPVTPAILLATFTFVKSSFLILTKKQINNYHAPPNLWGNKVYVSKRVFLI